VKRGPRRRWKWGWRTGKPSPPARELGQRPTLTGSNDDVGVLCLRAPSCSGRLHARRLPSAIVDLQLHKLRLGMAGEHQILCFASAWKEKPAWRILPSPSSSRSVPQAESVVGFHPLLVDGVEEV
jgi:hypothetical protein